MTGVQTCALPISLIVDNNTIELELDAEDLASNSFPLTCICLGKNTPDSDLGALMPGGTSTYRLRSGSVERLSSNGGTEWSTVYNNVVTAFLSADSRVYAYLADGTSNWKPEGAELFDPTNIISQSEYDAAKLLSTSIEL